MVYFQKNMLYLHPIYKRANSDETAKNNKIHNES